MKALVLFLATSVAVLLATQSFADTPLPAPKVKDVWSPNRQFCAVMDPKPMTTTVYRLERDGRRSRSWAMYGWFRVAHLADDGEHLVAGHEGINLLPLRVTKDEPMIRFFRRGELVHTVTLGDLLKDQANLKRTASHYLWGSYLGLDERGRYVVETVEKRRLVFNVKTGKPAAPDKRASATEGEAATPQ